MDNRPSRHRLVRLRSSRCEPPGQRRLTGREIGGAHVRIGLLTEGGYPYVSGDAGLWCDRLVRGLHQHEFDIYALSRSRSQEDDGWVPLPPHVGRVRTAPLWTAEDDAWRSGPKGVRGGAAARDGRAYGRRAPAASPSATESWSERSAPGPRPPPRRRPPIWRTVSARRCTGSPNSPARKAASSAPCARTPPYAPSNAPAARPARCARRARRAYPICSPSPHTSNAPCAPSPSTGTATTGSARPTSATPPPHGSAALPGLLARHFCDVPLLVTEYGVQLRSHYLALGPDTAAPAVRALLGAFHNAARRRGLPARRDSHTRQRPRPPLAGTVRRRPGPDPHRLPGHGRHPLRRGRRGPGPCRPGHAGLGGARRTRQGPDLAAARLRRGAQGGAQGAPEDHRRARRTRRRVLPRPLQGARRAALPGRGRGCARRRRQPGVLRGDRRPRGAHAPRGVRLEPSSCCPAWSKASRSA